MAQLRNRGLISLHLVVDRCRGDRATFGKRRERGFVGARGSLVGCEASGDQLISAPRVSRHRAVIHVATGGVTALPSPAVI